MMYLLKQSSDPKVRAHYTWMVSKGFDPKRPVELKPVVSSDKHLMFSFTNYGLPDKVWFSKDCFYPVPPEKDLEDYM